MGKKRSFLSFNFLHLNNYRIYPHNIYIYTILSPETYHLFLKVEFISAIFIFLLLFFISAPYGKHLRKQWKPMIKSSIAWIIMEFPAVGIMPLIFLLNYEKQSIVTFVFLLIWLSHYAYRTFIYPFKTNNPNKPFPVLIIAFGFAFNILNGFVNGYYLFALNPVVDLLWLISPKFIIGLSIFIFGFIINKQSESILKGIKRGPQNEYQIPDGKMFKYVSNPHYLGELLEWLGWAILCWSPAGLAFFLFSFANLFPRAISNHKWYKAHFKDYPSNRKAVIPYII